MSKKLTNYFESFLEKDPLFLNKKALQSNYTPEEVLYMDNQIDQIAGILAPALKMEKPSNLFIYGKTGTGKTLCVNFTTEKIKEVAEKKNVALKVFYVNCKLKRIADTEYRMVAQLAREFGEDVPITGLPTDEVYKIFLRKLDEKKILLL